MTRGAAETLFHEITVDFPASSEGRLTLPQVVRDLSEALETVDFSVKWVRSEADGRVYLVFQNSAADDFAKNAAAGDEKEAMVTVLKAVVGCLVEKKGALAVSAVRSVERGSLFEKQSIFLNDASAGGKIKLVARKQWLPTVTRLFALGWLESATVDTVGDDARDGDDCADEVGAGASLTTRGKRGQETRVFIGPRGVAELDSSLLGLVENCVKCHAVCLSPDPKAPAGEWVHIACANKTAELFPQVGGRGGEEGGAGASTAPTAGGKRKR